MLFLIGTVVVFACVIGGYVLHHGKLEVLWQPTEFLIIVGAAIGSFIIGNTGKDIKHILGSFKLLFKGKTKKKSDYVELLTLQYTVFKLMKSKGMLEIEQHLENPHSSSLFSQYPSFVKNHHALVFLCDYLRVMTMGLEDHFQLEEMMLGDIEKHQKEGDHASHAIVTMADAMPALGIVAAVLGVIVTMGSIDQPPAVLGKLIGAALVGTFLGVLLSYGLLAPIGRVIGAYCAEEIKYLECIKHGLIAHVKGNAPAISIEFARNSIPPDVRPTFAEVETATQAAGGSAAG